MHNYVCWINLNLYLNKTTYLMDKKMTDLIRHRWDPPTSNETRSNLCLHMMGRWYLWVVEGWIWPRVHHVDLSTGVRGTLPAAG